TRFPKGFGMMGFEDTMIGKNQSMPQILRMAYDPTHGHRLVLPKNLPKVNLDIMLTLPFDENPREKLQELIRHDYGLLAHFETNELDVLLMKQVNPDAPGLRPASGGTSSVTVNLKRGMLVVKNWPLRAFASQFDVYFEMPVFDQSGTTNQYDCNI